MTAGLVLVGASGLAREVIAAGIAGVAGILDDDEKRRGARVSGVTVVGSVGDAHQRTEQLLVCVGPSAPRRCVVRRLQDDGAGDSRFATFVARSARVGTTSIVNAGSILLDGVVVTADVSIGRHVVIMPNCTITHDDVIDDVATLAAGVTLGGGVTVGASAYLGMNASVRQGVTIGAGAIVGMGAVVLRDIPPGETWAGVPARPLKSRAPLPAQTLGQSA